MTTLLQTYRPLIALTAVAVLGALVLHGARDVPLMNAFMGFWLCLFALVKLFDVTGFADKFAQYDLIAQQYKPYALAFPFVELVLGLYYFAGWAPMLTDILMIGVAGATLISVTKKLQASGKFDCACMGTSFNMPLGAVTVIENGVMIVMALGHLVL